MGRGGESLRYGQGWRVSKVWAGVDTVFFMGVDDRGKKGVSMFLTLE